MHKLLGLGIGLTPSADDVILGMLYVFRKLRKAFPEPFNIFKSSVLESCGIRTNRISSAYLKAIADGAYFERMEQVWKGLCEVMPLDVSKLTTVGSNSGAEMLLGVGGINENNMTDYLKAGICGFGIGSNIIDKKMLEEINYKGITELAEKYLKAIQ